MTDHVKILGILHVVYGMSGILSGARAEEKKKAEEDAAKKK